MGDARKGDSGLRHREVPRPRPSMAEGRVSRNAMVILGPFWLRGLYLSQLHEVIRCMSWKTREMKRDVKVDTTPPARLKMTKIRRNTVLLHTHVICPRRTTGEPATSADWLLVPWAENRSAGEGNRRALELVEANSFNICHQSLDSFANCAL